MLEYTTKRDVKLHASTLSTITKYRVIPVHASIVMNVCFLEGIAKIDVLCYIHLYIPSLHFDQLVLVAKAFDRPNISRFCFWQMFNDFFLKSFFFLKFKAILLEKLLMLFLNTKLLFLLFYFQIRMKCKLIDIY